jgi:hypothetical protein
MSTIKFVLDDDFNQRTVEFKDHDNSRLKAWMHAATMVAAKIEGYTDA